MKLKLFLEVAKSIVSKKTTRKLINKLNDEYDDSLTYSDMESVRDVTDYTSKSSAIVVLLGFLSYLLTKDMNYKKKKELVVVTLIFGFIEIICNIISSTCDKIVNESEFDYGCDIQLYMHDDDDETDEDDEMIPDSDDVDAEIAEDIDAYDRNDIDDGDTAVGADSYI